MLGSSHQAPPYGTFAGSEPKSGESRNRHGFCYTKTGGRSIAEKPKRPPGRPRTGITPLTGLRIPAELNAKLDAWIERQPEPKPSRSEAIRRLLERALMGQ